MAGILADNNAGGHLEVLLRHWQGAAWREIWTGLGLPLETFERLGLPRDCSDATLWRACQEQQVLLLTCNRNEDGPESLEATIRTQNTEQCLPVFTLANPKRLLIDRTYSGEVAEKLLQYLLEIESYRGTGRLFVP